MNYIDTIVLDGYKYSVFIHINNLRSMKYRRKYHYLLYSRKLEMAKLPHFNLLGNGKAISISLDENAYCYYDRYQSELSLQERKDLVSIFKNTNLYNNLVEYWNTKIPNKYKDHNCYKISSVSKYAYIRNTYQVSDYSCIELHPVEVSEDYSIFSQYECAIYSIEYHNIEPHIWLHKKDTNEYTAISLISNKYINIANREYYMSTYDYEKWRYKYKLKQFYLSEDECKEFNKMIQINNDLISFIRDRYCKTNEYKLVQPQPMPDYNTIIRE